MIYRIIFDNNWELVKDCRSITEDDKAFLTPCSWRIDAGDDAEDVKAILTPCSSWIDAGSGAVDVLRVLDRVP